MNGLHIISPVLLGISLLSFTPAEEKKTTPAAPEKTQAWRTVTNNAFTYGEKLKFRLHYGIITAGNIEINIDDKGQTIDGRRAYHIDGYGSSISSFDWMFKVRDHFQTYIDSQSMLPLRYIKDQKEGGYTDHDYATFNYFLKKCYNKKGTLDINSEVQDVISIVYYARTFDIKNAYIGKEFPVTLYMDNALYNLKFKYAGKEVISTDIGKINAIKIVPQVVADRVFKSSDAMTIWVSDDENKIPLRIKADLLVGSIKCDITSQSGLRHALNYSTKK